MCKQHKDSTPEHKTIRTKAEVPPWHEHSIRYILYKGTYMQYV